MMCTLMWLNWSVTTINVTIQLLDIYKFILGIFLFKLGVFECEFVNKDSWKSAHLH